MVGLPLLVPKISKSRRGSTRNWSVIGESKRTCRIYERLTIGLSFTLISVGVNRGGNIQRYMLMILDEANDELEMSKEG